MVDETPKIVRVYSINQSKVDEELWRQIEYISEVGSPQLQKRAIGKLKRALKGGKDKLTRARVKEEIKRVRKEIAHDLEEYESKYPPPSGETLGRVITE